MKKQQFNLEEYSKLKHRIEALQSRVKLDFGPEQETAKRLLAKIERKLKLYEETHEIPVAENYSTTVQFDIWDDSVYQSTTTQHHNDKNTWNPNPNFKWQVHFGEATSYHEDTRSEAEMINDLGMLYAIFGSTYQTVLNYHRYKIRFKKQTAKQKAFFRVYADIYEDDIRICQDVIIGFWPFRFDDDRCGDMQLSNDEDSIKKYNNGCSSLYIKLLEGLKDRWNFYFDNQSDLPMLTGPVIGYIESGSQNKPKVQLNEEERRAIIDKIENEIDSGKIKSWAYRTGRLIVKAYKPYETLRDFLEESGVVYRVEASGVYIWNYEKFKKLVGYEYDSSTGRYYLDLV